MYPDYPAGIACPSPTPLTNAHCRLSTRSPQSTLGFPPGGFGQTYNDTYPPLQYRESVFAALKTLSRGAVLKSPAYRPYHTKVGKSSTHSAL